LFIPSEAEGRTIQALLNVFSTSAVQDVSAAHVGVREIGAERKAKMWHHDARSMRESS
jgi:hypothetical protein